MTGFEMALLMNTGAEAVESAIKLARKWAYKVQRLWQMGTFAVSHFRRIAGQRRRGGQGYRFVSRRQFPRPHVSVE